MKKLVFVLIILTNINILGNQILNAQEPVSQGKIIDQVIAIVGNNIILESAVENQFLQFQSQGYFGKSDLKCEVLEDLLFQKLLLNQAMIDSLEVTKKEVDVELDGRINQFIQQAGSPQELEKYFNKSLPEIKDEFREVIKDQILVRKMQSKIATDINVSPAEVRKFYNNIPKDSLPLIPTEYELLQIIKFPVVTREEKNKIKERLNELRERIVKGEKFSTLAILYSEDPVSAKSGGELGLVNKTDLVPEFSAVAFNLQPGEVSKIVETEFGMHIIQLVEKKGDQINVRHILITPKTSISAKAKTKKFLDSLSVKIRLDSIKFSNAALLNSDDETTKNNGGLMINQYTGDSKFETKYLDPATNYILKNNNLKVGEISEPFETKEKGKDAYKIIMLKSKTEAHVANLSSDYKSIQDMSLEKKKNDLVDHWVKNKQKDTYIHIDDSYKNCPFRFKNWLK